MLKLSILKSRAYPIVDNKGRKLNHIKFNVRDSSCAIENKVDVSTFLMGTLFAYNTQRHFAKDLRVSVIT